MNKLLKLITSLTLTLGVGALGSTLTLPSIDIWYRFLNKPFFSPPDWVFGPVWTALYILMGLSLYLVWNSKSKNKNMVMGLFLSQLGLNFLWSVIFFANRNPQLAFAEIIILWIFILMTIKETKKISSNAAYLLYPYLAWVTFASILNLSVAILN